MAKKKIFEVQEIHIYEDSIRAVGTVNTEGWKDPELILRPSSCVGGKCEFDFVAQSPDGPVTKVILPIDATYKSGIVMVNNHFIVYASNNKKGLFLE